MDHAFNGCTRNNNKPCTKAGHTSSKRSSPPVPLSSLSNLFNKTLKAGWGKVSTQLAGKTSHSSSSSDCYASPKPVALSEPPSTSGLMVPRSHALASANLHNALRSRGRMQQQGVLNEA
jgi:hypothetical protein